MSRIKLLSIFTIILVFTFSVSAQKKLVILHTNDTHSRIEPMPSTDRYNPNTGGVERRASYIDEIRSSNKDVLLFDSGDFLQGTPYFNLFKGEIEVKAMNLMKYDAATLGNHEFDYGLEVLEDIVRKASFPIISSNYDFSNTPLKGLIKPFIILKKSGIRIGVMGINIQPRGLIASANFDGMKFLSPEKTANSTAQMLKEKEKCDIIICLSHLGYQNDIELAKNTKYIDVILGGHSHTFMNEPEYVKNQDGNDVMVFQTGGRGLYVGRVDLELNKVKK